MKLAFLLGLALPTIYGETLTYSDNIALFEFTWKNPDQDATLSETGPTDGSLMTDSDTSAGETLTNPVAGLWGDANAATTLGMVGTFQATTLNLDTGYAYWLIDSASVVFNRDCFSDDTTATAFYYDLTTGAEETLTVTATQGTSDYTFSADITSSLQTNGYIAFNITSNMACEGDIEIMEFTLEGTQIATPEPTSEPTAEPTSDPTTQPTPAPVTPEPTSEPTADPTSDPTTQPTPAPVTPEPTSDPIADPTSVPTAEPTPEPTAEPTAEPETTSSTSTAFPTTDPTEDCDPIDFRLSIQLGQGSCSNRKWWAATAKNEGEIRYSDYLQDGGDWSVWAGDSSYKDAEAVRVGVWLEDDDVEEFCMKDTDIRFCIQLTDCSSDSSGNSNNEGDIMCTPWASEQGGWSDFAGPSDEKDFDAARVMIETQDAPGLEILDVQIGAWVSDKGCRNIQKAGDPVYSDWLVTGEGGHSNWGSDNDWKDPDAIAVYMGVYTNIGMTYNMASAFTVTREDEESSGLSTGAIIGIIAAVLACCLLTGFGFMWYRRRNKVLAAGVDDDEVIGTLEDTGITAGDEKNGYDMSPIGMDTTENPDPENEIMIEVEVTETQH